MESNELSDTAELEVIDAESSDESEHLLVEDPVSGKTKRLKRRLIFQGDDGNKYLAINERKKFRQRVWHKAVFKIESYKYLLYENGLVDTKLLRKSDFKPVPGENAVRVCCRLHWWSHGPQQIGIILVGLVLLGSSFLVIPRVGGNAAWALVGYVFLLVFLVLAYLTVWIPWAFHYILVTNIRVMLVYKPPFGLPGSMSSLAIKDILNIETKDQSPAKYIPSFGNLLPRVGLTGYKILFGDTAAQSDDWFKDGIYYMRHADEVENIITSTMAEAGAVVAERHDEDMDYQKQILERLTSLDGKIPNPSD